ncbi:MULTISPECIES: TIGR00730 family Rossman fold protein [Parageobacillus]|uniref:Cytokinin riboside 5'-monophosphate phosphoribohydrolase n=4 Tax=Anoxybacillaceae TaxID=3120669 RepID=A0AB38QUK6_PARTM|nr:MULTISPECIES: TIGR00730 family Rossman fold protein [Parageobacillus]AEH47871.1 Conserved hypothetical protein CHP00730 [Parageobacillus thermoglucosidasius C56-YS93]ALF10897.1 LOG family protein [Parageobacillus thermoglucosidasius]ANZ30973.1 Rossman fold protein, TIGR00730 family [Parageobacillus thermoglucosidasius]APM81710.1 Rossman fold protein, TIGR00730 family [Parageobacillus thermoglucosidasius]KJX69165.1 LOG family protein [Parageobacillus thermoglucosidasius]
MKSICVFCGSNYGNDMEYRQAARELGKFLASKKISLIYGGGKAGLMGEIANAVLSHKGRVIGIIPKFLKDKELAHDNISELFIVDTMHTRKAKMYELADGFIVMPGGYGTYEELFEVLSWLQIGIHNKPIGLLNVNGFFDPLIKMLEHTVDKGFAKPENLKLVISADNVVTLYQLMENFKPKVVNKWT